MVASFSPGDRVRLDFWAPSQALENLNYREQPEPGAEGYVLHFNDLPGDAGQVEVWWDDRGGGRYNHTPGRTVFVSLPGDRLSVCGTPHEIVAKVAALDDDDLDKELSFARGALPPIDDFEAWLWHHALEHEKETR